MLQNDVTSIGVAERSETFHQGCEQCPFLLRATRVPQDSNPRDWPSPLRTHHERPRGRRAAEEPDELAPFNVRHWGLHALGGRQHDDKAVPNRAGRFGPLLSLTETITCYGTGELLHCGSRSSLCPSWVRLVRSAIIGSMSDLPESGHGWTIYEYTP